MMRNSRFLLSRVDLASARKGVLVQSGSAHLLARAVDTIRSRLPHLELTVLQQRGMQDRLRQRADVRYIDNIGSKRSLVRELRANEFDIAFVLYSNEGGFWKLKLLPFFLATKGVLAINENLDWFPITIRRAQELAQHIRWRLESSMTIAPGGMAPLVADVAKAITYPAVLTYLLAYEQWKNVPARSKKTALGWKNPARHAPSIRASSSET
jgi:hypothetical protein